MTIYVTLAVMTSGSAAYTTTDEAGLVFASSSTDSAHTGSAWSGFCHLCISQRSELRGPGDPSARPLYCRMRHDLYRLSSMFDGRAQCGHAVQFLRRRARRRHQQIRVPLCVIHTDDLYVDHLDGSLFLLPLAVLFAAARASAIMFLGLVVGFCLTFVYMAKIGGPNAYALHILMQQSARRHLALEQATEHEVQG